MPKEAGFTPGVTHVREPRLHDISSRMPNQNDGGGKPDEAPRDVALIHGVSEDGDLRILRQREDRLELGAVRPLREGVPITGELIRLTPRKEFPLLCDVTSELTVPSPAPVARAADTAPSRAVAHKGPPRVTSDRYRENWDAIWANKKSDERVN